jgi:hypothetical protein
MADRAGKYLSAICTGALSRMARRFNAKTAKVSRKVRKEKTKEEAVESGTVFPVPKSYRENLRIFLLSLFASSLCGLCVKMPSIR